MIRKISLPSQQKSKNCPPKCKWEPWSKEIPLKQSSSEKAKKSLQLLTTIWIRTKMPTFQTENSFKFKRWNTERKGLPRNIFLIQERPRKTNEYTNNLIFVTQYLNLSFWFPIALSMIIYFAVFEIKLLMAEKSIFSLLNLACFLVLKTFFVGLF